MRNPEPGTHLHLDPQRSVRQQNSQGIRTAKGIGFSQQSDTYHDWTSRTGLREYPALTTAVARFSFPSPHQEPHFWISTVNKTPVGKTKSAHKNAMPSKHTRW